ncbi:MAG: helix-turn-helix domain-containing protein [Desulfatibacillaceae bacterium]|nr:helix-turn-helix domain-containing protein [Desulfatibacillaceae bacterium]
MSMAKDRPGMEPAATAHGPSFGAELGGRRKELGLDLQELGAITRIKPKILEDLEANKPIGHLPDVFVRGFVRSYAQALGLDPWKVLALYDEHQLLAASQNTALWRRRKAKNRLRRLLLFFCVALAAGLAGAMLVLPKESGSAVEPDASVKQADESIRRVALPRPSAAETAVRVLEVTALATTRLKVIADDLAPKTHELVAGDRLVLEANERFNLLIDSAGAVQLIFDGEPVPVNARAGMAVNIRLP